MSSFNEIINGATPVLVDFHAEWCGPCKMMPPELDNVKKEMGDEVRILKIDIDKNPHVANAYNVQSVPTLIIFRKGKAEWRQSGVVRSKQLISLLQSMKQN